MLLFRRGRLASCLLLFAFSHNIAADTMEMGDLFDIDFNTCHMDLDQVLADAKSLVAAGIKATDALLNSPNFATDTATRRAMYYMRFSFGTQLYPGTSNPQLSSNDVATIQTVEKNLKAIQTLLNGGGNGAGPINPSNTFFACGDDAYRGTTKASDVDAGNAASKTTKEVYDQDFLYINSDLKAGGVVLAVLPPSEGDTITVKTCQNPRAPAAFTVPSPASGNLAHLVNQVILCPATFKLINPLSSVSSTNSRGLDNTANNKIGNYHSVAGQLVHEMLHLIDNKFAEKPFTFKDAPGTELQAYGSVNVFAVANMYSELASLEPAKPVVPAINVPDAYAYFTQAVFWDYQLWNYGIRA